MIESLLVLILLALIWPGFVRAIFMFWGFIILAFIVLGFVVPHISHDVQKQQIEEMK